MTQEFEYVWKNYTEVDTEVQMVANLMKQHSLAADVFDTCCQKKMQTVGICSVNREEWLVTDLACNLIDVTSVPLYETLGQEILQIILD